MAGALQIVTAYNASTTGSYTFDNLASGSGDIVTAADGSLIVPSFPDDATCYLEEVWCAAGEAGILSLSGPDFIDRELGYEAIASYNVDGNSAVKAENVSPGTLSARLHPGNQFFARFADNGGGNPVNATFILRYSNLPGISARLAQAQAIKANAGKLVGMQVTVDPSSVTQGDWSTQVSLTATEGRKLDGTKYYAVVGFTAVNPLAAIAVSGYETGQLRIGAATVGEAQHDVYSLLDIGMKYSDSLIPVFRGYNQDQILVQAADPFAGSTLACVELVEVPESVYQLSQTVNAP